MVLMLQLCLQLLRNLNIAWTWTILISLMMNFSYKVAVKTVFALPAYQSTATSCLLAKITIYQAFGSMEMISTAWTISCLHLKSPFKMIKSSHQSVNKMVSREPAWLIKNQSFVWLIRNSPNFSTSGLHLYIDTQAASTKTNMS